MHMRAFEKLEDVPDLVPSELLIPPNRDDLRAPRKQDASPVTTTPLEVGYVLFGGSTWLNTCR